jgi:hypothetical protein
MSTLPKLLTNALTQEKDAINIPAMLEVLLLYLNNFPDGDPWKVVDAPLLVKNLGKQLKKACHGASASQWGPTLLPLLATLSDDTFALQLQLLKNMVRYSLIGTCFVISLTIHFLTMLLLLD